MPPPPRKKKPASPAKRAEANTLQSLAADGSQRSADKTQGACNKRHKKHLQNIFENATSFSYRSLFSMQAVQNVFTGRRRKRKRKETKEMEKSSSNKRKKTLKIQIVSQKKNETFKERVFKSPLYICQGSFRKRHNEAEVKCKPCQLWERSVRKRCTFGCIALFLLAGFPNGVSATKNTKASYSQRGKKRHFYHLFTQSWLL